MTVRKVIWGINFIARLKLNELTRGVTPLPMISQLGDPNLNYTTIVRRADCFTLVLWAIATIALLQVFAAFTKS